MQTMKVNDIYPLTDFEKTRKKSVGSYHHKRGRSKNLLEKEKEEFSLKLNKLR
jgi:hypothetical protein